MIFAQRLFFDYPWLLLSAVVFPFVVLLFRRSRYRNRINRLSRFAELSALRRLVGEPNGVGRSRTALLMLVVALCGLALAGPRWGVASGPTTARGIDMAIAIDASLSMLATDERPSRLERVKQEVRRLRAMSRADRVALIAFAGRSYILTPLTSDDGALELFLDNLDPSVVGQGGSSMSRTIRQGMELLLASSSGADKALVIMSDGEAFDTKEEIEAAAEEAGRRGVSIVAVGFGTTEGSTLPSSSRSTREKRDENGDIVVSKYNPDLLKAAATVANGTFIGAEESDKASRVRAALRSLRAARRDIEVRDDSIARFLWLLVPALALLIYDTARGERRRSKTLSSIGELAGVAASKGSVKAVMTSSVCLFALLSCRSEADPATLFNEGDVNGALLALQKRVAGGDSSSVVLYNLGSALMGADSLTAAAQLLENVRRNADGEVRMRARFNSGLALLKLGRVPAQGTDDLMAAARAAYRDLLQERPYDFDAKWNYELALRNPPQSGGGGGGDDENEDNDQQEPDDEPQSTTLDQKQAEALLNSAAREERDVQGRKQNKGRVPPQGKDW